MRQPLRRLPSVTAVMACVATLAFICCALFLPSAQAHSNSESEEVSLRREEQEILACQLRSNESLSGEFFSSASTNPDGASDFRTLIATIGHDSQLRCLSTRTCPGAPVTWCVHMYHPVETISLCYNGSGHVINITAAADRLRLQDKYQIQPEECSTNWPGCITLKSAEYFMTFSYMTCTAANQTCYHQTDYKLQVIASGERAEIPKIALDNNTNLYLNETNIFVCTSSLSGDPVPLHYSTWWEVDNVRVSDSVHYNPHCGTDISLSEQECRDANEASGATRERIRVHQFLYAQRYCPHPNVVIRVWLVIENATAEDAKKSYECHSIYTAINPSFQLVPHHEIFNIQPVYPLVDVVPIERPTSSPDLSYLLNSDKSLEWSCSVQAGLQDRLIWTHEGEEILDVDLESVHNLTNVTEGVYDSSSVENITCSSLQSIGDRVVVSETKTVSGYRRQFRSTLFICGTSERILGRYECLLRRERRDEKDVPIWSAILTTPETTEGPDTGTPFISQLKIIISVSVITSFVVIVFAVTIIAVCVRRKRASKQKHTEWKLAMGTLSVTEDILLDGFRRNNSLRKKDSLGPVTIEENDPLEFPRDKLVLLDRILGEGTFGVVRQARAEGIVESTPERNIVAVKTTKPKAPPHELNNFWEELQLMKNMEPQENLVNLLGYCTSPGGPIYMIIEYANHGSLKDFLKSCEEAVTKLHHTPQFRIYRSRRTSSASTCSTRYPQQICRQSVSAQNSVFSNLGTPTTATTTASSSGNFDFSSTPALHDALTRDRLITQDSGFFGESASQATFNDVLAITPTSNMAHMIAPLTHDYVNSKGLLYMEDIQNFALQIACGLKHLEDIEIVHCDLAARNILIAEGFVLKIGDFGMARDVSEKEYYRKQGGRIPVKWTAPEALQDHMFTYKSDIWSFGVILWEIFTYGQQPYSKFKIRQSWEPFIQYLMEGNRLSQPDGCPNNFYSLMQSCWDTCPNRRPTAEELVQQFSQANLLYEGGEDDQESESSQQEELTCNACNSHCETQV